MWWGNTAPTFNAVMLLNALQRGDQQSGVKEARRGNILAAMLVFLCGTLILAAYLGAGVYALWKAWQTGDWFNFWTSIAPPVLFVVLPIVFVIPLIRIWPLFTKQHALVFGDSHGIRDALALNDDRLTPPVPLQPAPLAPSDLAAGTVRLGPLRQLTASKPVPTPAAVAVLVLPITLFFLTFPLLFTFGFDNDFGFSFPAGIPFFPLFPLAIALVFGLPGVVIRLVVRQRNRGKALYATVDALGIQWHRLAPLKDEVRIPWGQVRSLSRVVYYGVNTAFGVYNFRASAYPTVDWGITTAYVLEAPEAVLVWTVGSFSTPQEVAASDALLRTVVTRTGKPLRELTGFAAEVAQAGGNITSILASRLPEAAPTAAFAPFMAGQQLKRRPRIWPWLVAAVVVLLFGSLYGGGAWAQSYQQTYFASLPARIHAEKPLFHDDLASPDGAWIQRAPDKSDYSGFAYANGGYQLSGNSAGNFVVATYPYTVFSGPLAYEVTATQSGTLSKDGGDGVGIVFNSTDSEREFMLFDVTYTGNWRIYHYKYVDDQASDNWNYIAEGRSNALHTGPGTTNQLLLVARGHYFLIYINGQFVESYNARYDAADLPTHGYVGLYLDDSTLVGTFNNLSVYPVKPATFPNWEYV